MTGQTRLCGLRTLGDNGRLLVFVLPVAVVFTLLLVVVGAFCVLLLADPLLRFLLFGIAFVHLFCQGNHCLYHAPDTPEIAPTTTSCPLLHHAPQYSPH